jgi:hypothetical protein
MKFPRPQFLHLAAGAAALPAVSLGRRLFRRGRCASLWAKVALRVGDGRAEIVV